MLQTCRPILKSKRTIKLIEDLGYDSIDLVHLINDLDGTFGIKMSDEMMVSEKLNTPRETDRTYNLHNE